MAADQGAVYAQTVPSLTQRERIGRGLIRRLEDPLRISEEDLQAEDIRDQLIAEFLLPSAVLALTYAIVRSDRPPDMTPADVARVAICQRVLNAMAASHGLIRYHLYVEAIEASRPLLECALLLDYFLAFPAEAKAWAEAPERFRSPADLRERLGRKRHDPIYSWSSEHGDHVTAAAFGVTADLSEDGRIRVSVGGRYDERLQRLVGSVLLMSASAASHALVSTWLHDLLQTSRRGQSAFFQFARSGHLAQPSLNAIAFTQQELHENVPAEVERLVAELLELQNQYAREAANVEAAGLGIPAADVEF